MVISNMTATKIKPARVARARDVREWLAAYDQRLHGAVTIFLIGIRDLKQINERNGRNAGDAAIRAVGKMLLAFAKSKGEAARFVGRLPGREFLIILGGHHGDAEAKALLDSLSGDIGSSNASIRVNIRAGIAQSASDELGPELHFRASEALSQAYTRKGKRYVIADATPTDRFGLQAILDAELRAAIDTNQIAIMLQPQFAVANGHLIGAEALARWHHPKYGEIGAGQLFACADRCDLREELSNVIQREALSIAAHWSAALGDLRLSVNLGAGELGEGFADGLLSLLQEKGFSARRLTLELTEESLVRDIDLASVQLERLRESGVKIAVDDFGTGYSSLAYLKALPLDYLKLDKGMTPDISGMGKDRIVLRAIIAMGKALGLGIIAEGVESESELDMLAAEGCDYFQGFLRSPPLSAEEFERFALLAN
jgi:diguanylate cyclase